LLTPPSPAAVIQGFQRRPQAASQGTALGALMKYNHIEQAVRRTEKHAKYTKKNLWA